jgi:DNA mismatch endonuclease (patch repair protein)
MRNIRSQNTSIENILYYEIKKLRLKILRNDITLTGRPDFVFKRKKVVVFADSCFWHFCPYHSNVPKSNKKYWFKKLLNNKKRDHKVTMLLRRDGWVVIRLWEHQIKNDIKKCMIKINEHLVS